MRGGRAFSMPDRRDAARGRAAPTIPPMRPLRLPPKDNAVPANSAHATTAPPLLRTLWQCACRPRTIQLPRPENAAADRRPRTTPFPPTPAMRPPLLRTLRQCACRTRTTQLPHPENAAADSHARTTPLLPTPAMRLSPKDDTAPAPRECSRRPSPKDNAIPARCSIMRLLRSHSRTTPFLCPPSIRCGGEAMLMRNHIDCAKEQQAFWNHFICFVAQAPFAQTLQ